MAELCSTARRRQWSIHVFMRRKDAALAIPMADLVENRSDDHRSWILVIPGDLSPEDKHVVIKHARRSIPAADSITHTAVITDTADETAGLLPVAGTGLKIELAAIAGRTRLSSDMHLSTAPEGPLSGREAWFGDRTNEKRGRRD